MRRQFDVFKPRSLPYITLGKSSIHPLQIQPKSFSSSIGKLEIHLLDAQRHTTMIYRRWMSLCLASSNY